MQERLNLLEIGFANYESLSKPGEFLSQSFHSCINGLTLGSTASTPVRLGLKDITTSMLLIPLVGSGNYRMGGESIDWRANEKAALMPAGDFTGESTLRCSLSIHIDPDRLEATAHHMLGIEPTGSHLIKLDRPQEIALRYGNISFDQIFRNLTGSIDLLSSQPDLLSLSGLDDGIYRTMVMMLRPDLFATKASVDTALPYKRGLLDRVCQYIQENKYQSITLTDLERVSCMSKRNLQYSFQRTFNCTPMAWVRVQRIEMSRSMLMDVGVNLSITAIGLLCGFNDISSFSRYYQLRFGESPSTTIANRH